ncbi:uncharacterized protein LOC115210327 [Argonauta hians]
MKNIHRMTGNKEIYLLILQLAIVVLLSETALVQTRCTGDFPCNDMRSEERRPLVLSDLNHGKQRDLHPWEERESSNLDQLYTIDINDNIQQREDIDRGKKKSFNPWGGKRSDSNSISLPLSVLREHMMRSPELRSKMQELWRKRNFSPWGGK